MTARDIDLAMRIADQAFGRLRTAAESGDGVQLTAIEVASIWTWVQVLAERDAKTPPTGPGMTHRLRPGPPATTTPPRPLPLDGMVATVVTIDVADELDRSPPFRDRLILALAEAEVAGRDGVIDTLEWGNRTVDVFGGPNQDWLILIDGSRRRLVVSQRELDGWTWCASDPPLSPATLHLEFEPEYAWASKVGPVLFPEGDVISHTLAGGFHVVDVVDFVTALRRHGDRGDAHHWPWMLAAGPICVMSDDDEDLDAAAVLVDLGWGVLAGSVDMIASIWMIDGWQAAGDTNVVPLRPGVGTGAGGA